MIDIKPIRPKFHLEVLSADELAAIRSATLHILEQVGVCFPSERALRIFAEYGAQVDAEGQIVRLPPDLVTEAMSRAPRAYTLVGRAKGADLLLDGTRSYFGTDGCGVETVDFETGKHRPSTKEDVARMARVADALSSIAFYWPMVSAQDYGRISFCVIQPDVIGKMKEITMYSETPNIIPFTSPFKSELLTQAELETLKGGTLRLLNGVGVHFPSRKALEIFADHGARVDMDKEIVRIPPDLVKKAMSTAPRSFVLGGREERFDLLLDGNCSYLATDGTGVHVIDLETRQMRPSRKADVAMMARVCDALPLIGFYWPLVSAQDYGKTAPLHQCHAGLTNTLKHVRGGMTVPPQLAPYVVEMAMAVAGNAEAFRQRPPICANFCTIAPLAQDGHSIENALTYAEAGIPISFMAMPTMGSTAPATPLGALVMGDAEVISGMVLLQLAYPGAPVFHSIIVSLMEPRTGSYVGKASEPLTMMAVELAHAWNVPSLGGGSVSSDAPDIGWQSGMEAGIGAATIPLIMGEICGYMGLIEGSMVLYPESVILDHEICQAAYDLLHGFEFDEADMALDVIKAVGPRGHFLAQKHTRKHIRDFRLSPLLRQKNPDGGPRDPRDVALEEFKRLNETHHPRSLPQEVLAELDRILAAAEREVES